jgi:hypothetical protein
VLVFLGQFPVPGECGFEAGEDRVIGGALARGDGWGRGSLGRFAEPRDFDPEIGLGIQPGPGDTGGPGDGFEGYRGSPPVEVA